MQVFFPMNFAKLLRTPILKNICERLLLVAGWRTTKKLRRRDLLLLTCLVYINISLASFFPFFICNFFIHVCFGFDETKLTNRRLYGELWSVLNYYIKERQWQWQATTITMTKTGYNNRDSKSDLRLNNFKSFS